MHPPYPPAPHSAEILGMNLLVRAVRDLRRLWWADLGVTVMTALGVLAVEILGRECKNDLHDLLCLLLIGMVAVGVLIRHRTSPLPWITIIAAAFRRLGGWLRR